MRKTTSETVNLEGGKNRIQRDGDYHLLIVGPDDGIEHEDHAAMECKVIGVAPGFEDQLDKTVELKVDFFLTRPSGDEAKDKMIGDMIDRKIANVTTALMLTEEISGQTATTDLWRTWKGKEIAFNFENAKGRQFVGHVTMREFELKDRETGQPTGEKGYVPDFVELNAKSGKFYPSTIYSPLDAKAERFPRNMQYVALLRGSVAPQPQQSQGQQVAPQQAAPATAAATQPQATATPQSAAATAVEKDPWADAFA